ncbi:Chemotaxis response regulator protein-glutamate methylesterase [ANME-1 cluster archaeon GoMg2]|nr:Chemotaxis response regulator protein-glutamate methylesterase [ANME-1 cluster archaeon GoMg2]
MVSYNGYHIREINSAKREGEKEKMKDRAQKRDNRKEVHYVMRLRKRTGRKYMKLGGERKMKNGLVYGCESAMPIRILHVDDEPSHLEITRIYLKREAKDDFEIVSVLSAKEALDKLENEYFDVIVSDYKMPEMNGLEFLDAVRRNEKSADIPFVLFTGAGGHEVAEEALNNGAERYVTKKGSPATQCNLLAQTIRDLVRNERTGDADTGSARAELKSLAVMPVA